ncbi:calponin homology domain-containing protein DDB_G0272472 isoform X2 [Aricia agestis]|uniref:calponin homology domain-containing protein DDB_G0272472 isoform X2 n=1 Tax=Aricia agestis TaxID=91739 RepID=UPI001C20A614|nr:calponin homology domain-containing protein DDB_G0272472 isoform X2 [Aricia agestis]
MEEVRQLVQEEGREARNLVAFHVAVDSPARVSRKPPKALPPARRAPPRATRLRSASAGRDKRSELRARYWALLFGDLQRSVGEIYNTVEAHENVNECQEVILVLENYTRDFKALAEWFRLKWEYDNTPPLQRPQSLAWEIRKTDFVRPESRRAYSVKSSPSVSGKNSPCLSGHNTPSGKNSPNLTGKASPGSGKISPRIVSHNSSPKGNIEFFSNKIVASKITAKPEPKLAKETSRLSDIKEKETKETNDEDEFLNNRNSLGDELQKRPTIVNSKDMDKDGKSSPLKLGKTKLQDVEPAASFANTSPENLSGAAITTKLLDEMENSFLAKNLKENYAKNDNVINKEAENRQNTLNSPQVQENNSTDSKETLFTESPNISEDNFADISNESSNKSDEIKTEVSKDMNEKKTPENLKEGKTQNEKIHTVYETTSPQSKDYPEIDGHTILNTNKDSIENNKVDDRQKQALKMCTDKLLISDAENVKSKVNASSPCKENLKDESQKKETDVKKIESKQIIEAKPTVRPAYSQAAAKPKSPNISKVENKTPTRLVRSSTVVEMRPAVPKTQRSFQKKVSTNKCSYPFNLTTGRTSLFDTPASASSKGNTLNRSLNKSVQMASGDGKFNTLSKTEPKRKISRPTSLKVNEKPTKQDTKPYNSEKLNECQDHSSSETLTAQIEISRIESNESLKTLVPKDFESLQDISSSVEVLNIDNKSDNDGWLTVKSRRIIRESKKHPKSHWAKRFNQPSATTSLPTLNMLESPKQENKSITEKGEVKKEYRAKSEQPPQVEKNEPPIKHERSKPASKHKSSHRAKDSSMVRQKSDVTGLKTRSSKNRAISRRSERKGIPKEEDSELAGSRLHSSLESLTTALARSQESTEDAFDFDKWKAEFKSTFKYFDDDDGISDHNEILKTADPSEMSEIAEMTSLIEENERKMSLALDFQCEVDQRKLCEEEDLLNRQILELQQVSDVDIDTETDDTETDAEILCEGPPESTPSQESLGSLAASLEDQYETALAGMSWAERVDTLVVLEALVARDPGRAQQLHAKLSQGIKRRGSLQDALRRLQTKQARAERQRMEYQTERAKRIHQLLARVEEVKVAKNQLIEGKRLRMERRLQKATENRDQHLKDIVRKAHDEEEKLREIAFIKQLEAENRRHEFLDQCRSHTTRLRQMRRDRLEKLEAKAAHEAAVGERRAALEAARQHHVAGLLQRRRERTAHLEQLRERERRRRGDAAREKAEGVKSRLSALAAAAELEADALRCRIRDKQDASQLRLESHLQAIRERATGPRQPTTSESQDQPNEINEIEEEAQRKEQEKKEREKQKTIKKKARKLKQRLLASGTVSPVREADFSSIDPIFCLASNKIYKVLSSLNNMISSLNDTKPVNGFEAEEEKPKKKKKSKLTNGDTESVKSDDKDKLNNNNDQIKEKDQTQKDDKLTNGEKTNEDKEPKKKNRKKNKNNNDVPKLSKTNSVCSSMSDMSRNSGKSEKKVVLDLPQMEKQMNELYRFMEKLDKTMSDKTSVLRYYTVKVIGDLLEIAAEKEELASQLSTKCITTAVTLASRVQGGLTANCCVHLITLLARQLEKDLQSDPKELDLAKQLSDCLSVAFDTVLCFTRVYQEMEKKDKKKTLSALRNRAHLLICYLCSSGCITRAENAGEVRESIQTLLTVCADLCHPCDADVGSERSSAKQALRSALGKSICGSRAEFCLLFAQGASLEQCGGFVRAARTAHLLRTIAEMDHEILQEAFGEGRWPLEFRAAVARLLSQHAPNEKEAPRKLSELQNPRLDQTLSETMVLDLIVLVGFVVVNNPQLQETICSGWSVIKTLCTLPANWLVSSVRSRALLPTLVALADHPASAAAISAELSMEMLEEFLENPETQTIKLIQVIKQGRAKNCTDLK